MLVKLGFLCKHSMIINYYDFQTPFHGSHSQMFPEVSEFKVLSFHYRSWYHILLVSLSGNESSRNSPIIISY